MALGLVLGLVILLIGLYLYQKSNKQVIEDTPEQESPYAGAKIDTGDFPCSAAFDCSSKIFLKSEVPPLPLTSCGQKSRCRCRYIYFKDRRQNLEDRRSGSKVLQDIFNGDEKRTLRKRGRRQDD